MAGFELLLSLAKSRLADILLQRGDAFRYLIKRCIVRNIDRYMQNDATKQRFKETISPRMRNEILFELLEPRFIRHGQEQIDEFNNIMEALPFLLSSMTKQINLCSLYRCFPEDLKEVSKLSVFDLIAEKAPNMERLAFTFKGAVVSKPIVQSLIRMKQLRGLKLIGGILHWQDFVEICKNLPNLIHIKFARFDESADCIRLLEMKRNLKDISHLKSITCGELCCRIMEFFEKNLPDFQWCCAGPLTNHAKAFDLDGNNKKTATARSFMYRPLYHRFANKIPAKFPNIVSYQMDCHEAKYKDSLLQHLPDFRVLQNLRFARLNDPQILYHALVKYGGNLRKVTVIGHGEPSLDIERIFELSPNLEHLELVGVRLINHSGQINHSRLMKLALVNTRCDEKSSILLAPQLQVVTLCGHYSELLYLCFEPLMHNVSAIFMATRQYRYTKMIKISKLTMVVTDFENISDGEFIDFHLFFGEIGEIDDVHYLQVDPFHRIDLAVDANLIEILKAYH